MTKRKWDSENDLDYMLGPGSLVNKEFDSDHEIDSDDDVSEKKTYDILAEDDIEGQEEGASGFKEGVLMTAFNMKEELEEGHFDTDGNYHWRKEDQIRDNWMDNIDWEKIKNRDQNKTGNDSDSDDDSTSSFDHIAVYRQMLELMKPGESVAKALRRFGGNKTMSASERWRRRKEGRSDSNDTDTKLVTQLTELANQLVNRIGNMDVYQETYEHISKLIRNADAKKGKSSVRTAASYDDALDMYADDFDEKEKERLAKQPEKPSSEDEQSNSNEVMWEFKWEESSSDIHGPHSSSQMQSWVEQGYFKSSVLVRKCGSEGQFYNSARVDFELYM